MSKLSCAKCGREIKPAKKPGTYKHTNRKAEPADHLAVCGVVKGESGLEAWRRQEAAAKKLAAEDIKNLREQINDSIRASLNGVRGMRDEITRLAGQIKRWRDRISERGAQATTQFYAIVSNSMPIAHNWSSDSLAETKQRAAEWVKNNHSGVKVIDGRGKPVWESDKSPLLKKCLVPAKLKKSNPTAPENLARENARDQEAIRSVEEKLSKLKQEYTVDKSRLEASLAARSALLTPTAVKFLEALADEHDDTIGELIREEGLPEIVRLVNRAGHGKIPKEQLGLWR